MTVVVEGVVAVAVVVVDGGEINFVVWELLAVVWVEWRGGARVA